ncbi:MAG TPA: MarR family transcriptional regulator [Micromonosporaceae bacterium]|jgi:DNA-binding MarR family transcriptional regulator
MSSVAPEEAKAARSRRRLTSAVRDSLRELIVQLSVLNHHIGARLDIRDIDLDCLDVLAREGPLSPSALARRAGLHPATMTGVLDRLERAGWIERARHPSDRRAILVRPLGTRSAEILGLYAGMNRSMDEICAGYQDDELQLLADFLRRTAEAGRRAADDLAGG